MKVVICGSRKFTDEIRELGRRLKAEGHIVFEPILNKNTAIDDLPSDLKRYAFLGLTYHHFEAIRKAEVCFIYNKGGYIGNSATLEIGYAAACAIPIYALEEDTSEPCRNVLFEAVLSVDEFIKLIAGKK